MALATKSALGALPFRLQAGPTLILVHGTPTLNTIYRTEDRTDSFCRKMAAHAGARAGDMIAFGHTHKPWHQTVACIHLVNTGSVGRPTDGDWRAGYTLVTLEAGAVAVERVLVECDLAQIVEAIHASILPDELAEIIQHGG